MKHHKIGLLAVAAALMPFSLAAVKIEPGQWQQAMHVAGGTVEGNVFSAKTVGKDPQLVVKGLPPFAAADNIVIRFEMKTEAGITKNGELFWFTSAAPGFVAKQRVGFPVTADGNWHPYELDMGGNPLWVGNIAGLRLDPAIPEKDGGFSIRNFEVIPLTEKRLPVENWRQLNHLKDRKIGNGELTCVFSGKDPNISYSAPLSIPAEKLGVLKFELLLPAEADPTCQVFWFNSETKKFSEQQQTRIKVKNDGQWHEYAIDLSVVPGWAGIVQGLRIDPTPAPGAAEKFQIRNIRLAGK